MTSPPAAAASSLEAHQEIEHLEDLDPAIEDVAGLDKRRLAADPVHVTSSTNPARCRIDTKPS